MCPDVGDGEVEEDGEGQEEDKDGALDGLPGQKRHDCASCAVALHASFQRSTVKSDQSGALTSELFSWRKTWKKRPTPRGADCGSCSIECASSPTLREREERSVKHVSDDIYDGEDGDCLREWAGRVRVADDDELVQVESGLVLPQPERGIRLLRVVRRLDEDRAL